MYCYNYIRLYGLNIIFFSYINRVIMSMVIKMTYLDYSATTPVDEEVLDSFIKINQNFIGNPNSLHILGVESNKLIENATKQILSLLNAEDKEVIYTSGSSESNNLAIKGLCLKYQNRGKHIITTAFEHSSIYGPISYLQSLGFEVDFVKTKDNGLVDLEHLKSLIREDTILVSITAVNSEIGIKEPIEEIGILLKDYNKCFFHVDATQAIGKFKINLENIDLMSFSAHKIYGLKGIGCLIKNKKLVLEPIIHGGKSTTIYRSGTPPVALIASIAKALRLIYENMEQSYQYVGNLNKQVKKFLEQFEKVQINSNTHCVPHILNFSVIGVKPETLLHALEEDQIYISTKTACSSNGDYSKAVMALTNDEKRAASSVRISLSHKTTEEEIKHFCSSFEKCYKKLTF